MAGVGRSQAPPVAAASPLCSRAWVFRDVTDQAGLARIARSYAVAAADYDQDGWPDLMISNHEPEAALYRNLGDGSFAEQHAGRFPRGDTHGITWFDLDDDGWLDLLLSTGGNRGRGGRPNRAYRNAGDGTFEPIQLNETLAHADGRGRHACPADVDGDGLVDLLLTTQVEAGQGGRIALRRAANFVDAGAAVGWHRVRAESVVAAQLAAGSEPVYLTSAVGKDAGKAYRRGDQGELVDVSSALGLRADWAVSSLVLGDYDNDGDTDVYQVIGPQLAPRGAEVVDGTLAMHYPVHRRGTDYGFRCRAEGAITLDLYVAERRRPHRLRLGGERRRVDSLPVVVDVGDPALAGDPQVDAETDVGVYLWRNDEGALVVEIVGQVVMGLVGGELRATGGLELLDQERPPERPRGGDGFHNRLLENRDGVLVDVTASAGVGDAGYGTDGVFADLDNDGDLDLYVVNGGAVHRNAANVAYENLGDGTFVEVTDKVGLAGPTSGRAATILAFDFDRDGDLDLFSTNGHGPRPYGVGPYVLWRNDTSGGASIAVTLQGPPGNRQARGARVTVRDGDWQLTQQCLGTTGRFSSSVLPLHFGIGARSAVDVRVEWPSGHAETTRAVAGQHLVLQSSKPAARPTGQGR